MFVYVCILFHMSFDLVNVDLEYLNHKLHIDIIFSPFDTFKNPYFCCFMRQ